MDKSEISLVVSPLLKEKVHTRDIIDLKVSTEPDVVNFVLSGHPAIPCG